MSKKQPPQQVSVALSGEVEHTHIALYKTIQLKEDALRFLHLERKGNTWLLLDALEYSGDEWTMSWINYIRDDRAGMVGRTLTIGGAEVEVRAYTVIHIPGQEFYHLDQLPDGSWRITHSDGFLQCDHNTIRTLSIRKV